MRITVAAGGTGGHIYPALAVVRRLSATRADAAVDWVGGHRGLEHELVPGAGLPLTRLWLRSLRTVDLSIATLLDPLRLAASVPQAAAVPIKTVRMCGVLMQVIPPSAPGEQMRLRHVRTSPTMDGNTIVDGQTAAGAAGAAPALSADSPNLSAPQPPSHQSAASARGTESASEGEVSPLSHGEGSGVR